MTYLDEDGRPIAEWLTKMALREIHRAATLERIGGYEARDRAILRQRLEGRRTLRSIGEEWGLSIERVRGIARITERREQYRARRWRVRYWRRAKTARILGLPGDEAFRDVELTFTCVHVGIGQRPKRRAALATALEPGLVYAEHQLAALRRRLTA